jgi:fatty acid desaturase
MISLIWLRDLLLDWLLIFLAIAIGLNFWYLIPVSIFIIGNRQHALAILGHDATHKLVSKNNRINYMLGNFLCYAPLGS